MRPSAFPSELVDMQENCDSSDLCQSYIVKYIMISYRFRTFSVILYLGLQLNYMDYMKYIVSMIFGNFTSALNKRYLYHILTHLAAFHCRLSSSS